jgi:hypothetical protein
MVHIFHECPSAIGGRGIRMNMCTIIIHNAAATTKKEEGEEEEERENQQKLEGISFSSRVEIAIHQNQQKSPQKRNKSIVSAARLCFICNFFVPVDPPRKIVAAIVAPSKLG